MKYQNTDFNTDYTLFFSNQEWEDANLVWKPDDYGGVTNLRVAPDKVWRPDILMYNR